MDQNSDRQNQRRGGDRRQSTDQAFAGEDRRRGDRRDPQSSKSPPPA